MAPPQVRRLIARHETIRTLCSEQASIVEDLPVTLSYAISAPSSESTPSKAQAQAQAKAEVLAGEAIFEIGKRLKHVKENDLVHGEWATWCVEKLKLNRKTADKFIVVFEHLGANDSMSSQIGMSALYEIATMPEKICIMKGMILWRI